MRITVLMPDCDMQLGNNRVAVQQMIDITAAWDEGGALPAPFVRVTPNTRGHGETYYHPQGLFIIRTEHRPVLLTTEVCATCAQRHLDTARIYLFGSWTDFENRAYMRYVQAQIEPVGLASNEVGA